MADGNLSVSVDKSPQLERLSVDLESFDVGETRVQHYGLLMKKPFGHKSARWQKRFFIVKEGFLLYYPESENKTFEKSHHFNIHPKGVIPLGGCKVEELYINGPQKYSIKITNSNFKGEIHVGADDREEAEEWVKVLKEAGKVTWRNAQLGENIITKLEEKSQEMATEMKDAIDKLNEEASAREIETEKKLELEALSAKLEAEKKAIEEATRNLREEKDTAALELQHTMSAMKQIEEEKMTLEQHQQQLQQEKEATEVRLQERELTAKKLEEDKKQISNTALHLRQDLEQVSQEKAMTESKWKEERKRRIKTENRLRLAEDSLKRLDRALRDSGIKIDLQIETDVKNLKEFFEECIKEEQYEAQKLDILRDAVRAKVTYSSETKRLSANGGSPEPLETQI